MSAPVYTVTLVCLIAVVIGLLLALHPQPPVYVIPPDVEQVHVTDEQKAVSRFSDFLKYASVSNVAFAAGMDDAAEPHFAKQLEYLKTSYHTVWQNLKIEQVNTYSLLLTWPGSNASLDPLVYISHLDVVPATGNWTHPPFSGAVVDGYIWGRGTIDVKVSVAAILEATQQLLHKGYRPERTVLLAFGHDEELGGSRGAAQICELLQQRGVKPWMTLDEGGFVITEGGLPKFATQTPIALIGVSEKGSVTVQAKLQSHGGHSSIPPPGHSQVAVVLSKLVARTGLQHPSTKMTAPMAAFLKSIAHLLPFPLGSLAALADVSYARDLLAHAVAVAGAKLAPMFRTTCACVNMRAGVGAENVVPPSAAADFNFRLLPGDSDSVAFSFLRRQLGASGKDASLQVTQRGVQLAAPVSDMTNKQWDVLQQTILQSFHKEYPGLVIAPYLLVGATDSKNYPIAEDRRYRFLPLAITMQEVDLLHSIDERVQVRNFIRAVEFFMRMTLNAAGRAATERQADGADS